MTLDKILIFVQLIFVIFLNSNSTFTNIFLDNHIYLNKNIFDAILLSQMNHFYCMHYGFLGFWYEYLGAIFFKKNYNYCKEMHPTTHDMSMPSTCTGTPMGRIFFAYL